MIKLFTTTQPDAETFELRTNNAGNILTNVETVGPDFVAGAYTEALAVTDWYLDGLTGDDTNDGKTLATPLKTGAELSRRLGPQAAWDHNVTIHVGVGGVPDLLSVVGDTLVPDVHIDIIGTVTDQIDAGTIASITSMDHATPRSPTLSATNITDWSFYVGKRLRVTSGTNAGAVTWVLKENPHALGINVARTGRFYKILNGPSDTTIISAVTPSVGDSIVIETLPLVSSLNLQIGGAVNPSISTLNPWNYRQYSVQNIDIDSGSRDCSSDFLLYRNVIFGCKIQAFTSVNGNYAVSTNSSPITACLFYSIGGAANGVWAGGCFLASPGTNMTVANNASQSAKYYYCVGQSVQFASGGDSFSNVQTFDCLANYSAFSLRGFGLSFSNVSSAGNASYGVSLQNAVTLVASGTINITGTVGNVRLNSSPTANLTTITLANLVPCPDFAWSGTATLVAGTVAVVVPYVNWTEQKITFGRANPLGITGDLSVPTATRTSTGFVINSSNVADVSTVDWQITATGRAISITK